MTVVSDTAVMHLIGETEARLAARHIVPQVAILTALAIEGGVDLHDFASALDVLASRLVRHTLTYGYLNAVTWQEVA